MYKDYEDIKNEYYYIRQNNLLKYEEKKEKIYNEHPLLREFDYNIITLFAKKASNLKDKDSDEDFEKAIAALKVERKKYLNSNGIKDDYLDVKYTCEKCKDTGFIDGKKCSCLVAKEIAAFSEISDFTNIAKKDNFEKLDLTYYSNTEIAADGRNYNEYMKSIILEMRQKASALNKSPYNALFIGPTGTGKTFLTHCIGAEALKINKSVLCLNINEYVNSLMPNAISFEPYAVSCDLFILDDLGTENTSDFINSKLYYIIDKRLNTDKSTIITTNLSADELGEKYLSSIVSRLLNTYTLYNLQGEDLRRVRYANC